MSTEVAVGTLAHGLHVTVVLLGLWGLAALLLPHVLEQHFRRSLLRSAHRGHHPAASRSPSAPGGPDDHVRRIAALRVAAASGTLATLPPAPTSEGGSAERPSTPAGTPAGTLALPLVVVAGTTAAGIHAAVAPLHLAEDALFAAFFVAVAAAQLGWVVALTSRPRASILRVGLWLNASLIALRLVTRSAGLPFGLLDAPHPVGGWDVVCVAWQSIAIGASVHLLRSTTPPRLPGWFAWHPAARASVGAAAVLLVLLVVTGAHA